MRQPPAYYLGEELTALECATIAECYPNETQKADQKDSIEARFGDGGGGESGE